MRTRVFCILSLFWACSLLAEDAPQAFEPEEVGVVEPFYTSQERPDLSLWSLAPESVHVTSALLEWAQGQREGRLSLELDLPTDPMDGLYDGAHQLLLEARFYGQDERLTSVREVREGGELREQPAMTLDLDCEDMEDLDEICVTLSETAGYTRFGMPNSLPSIWQHARRGQRSLRGSAQRKWEGEPITVLVKEAVAPVDDAEPVPTPGIEHP